MNEHDDSLSTFGSIEEGDCPLEPYLDPVLFQTLDKQAQIEQLTPAFDAITLAGVDYDLTVQDSATGKRYTLRKNKEVISILLMDNCFTDNILEAIDHNQPDE